MDALLFILVFSALNAVLMAAILYKIHQINAEFSLISEESESLKAELGGVFNVFMNKLDKFEQMVPDIEPANPFLGILQSMMENQTPKDREPSGQFIRAQVIEPSDD